MRLDEQIGLLAANHPAAVAVEEGDRHLSYGQLWRRATSVAGGLRAAATPGSLIPIVGQRGIDWIVALLAVMRAGMAFVPIDEANPAPRQAAMVVETGSELFIRVGPTTTALPGGATLTELAAHPVGSASSGPRAPRAFPDCAYAIFTSGSTGHPKAVLVSHRGLCHLAGWHARAYSVGIGTRVLHTASLGFDAAVWELLPNLAAGATIVVASDDTRMIPSRLVEQARRSRIDLFFASTFATERILANVPDDEVPWHTLLTGGDVLHVGCLPVGWRLVNHYGPTEGTVVATAWTVDRIPSDQRAPIGTAIDEMLTQVVDERLVAVPPGQPGELLLGGPMVALGYHGRPELTREKFISRPGSGERWYRTGDLVRTGADGLEFLGRIDDQVQLRGVRIEPGEVEALLLAHPGVVEAVCCGYHTSTGNSALGAMVVAASEITGAALRRYLASRLPSAMVPSRIDLLDRMPLTLNGKIDVPRIRRMLGPGATKESGNA
jgi:amino acid adenylation domain-containing protein